MIDEALKQHPESFDALLDLLRQAGYEIKGNPANPSLRGGAQKRFVRMDTLGPGYTPAELKAVIAGERPHTPKQRKAKAPKQPQRTNQFLIDIQEKLAQGKGGRLRELGQEVQSETDGPNRGLSPGPRPHGLRRADRKGRRRLCEIP